MVQTKFVRGERQFPGLFSFFGFAPITYELVINIKAAKQLGIDVPPRLSSPSPTR